MPPISIAIILCHYEQLDQLYQSLCSVACQLRAADQIIVVDDGSRHPPEQTELNRICSIPITLLQNEKNHGGPAIPRNQAITACGCSHLAFLDADDILMPHALQAMEAVWKNNSSAIAYGDQISWGNNTNRPILQRALSSPAASGSGSRQLYEQLLMGGNRLFLSGSGGPTDLFASHCFDPQQRWEDYDLWLRLAQNTQPFEHTGRIHTLYRLQLNSRSGSRRARHQGCQGIQKKHLQNRAVWRWPLWYWKQRYL
jgi:glycosyltransferase involved in cell wall biosynthesis